MMQAFEPLQLMKRHITGQSLSSEEIKAAALAIFELHLSKGIVSV